MTFRKSDEIENELIARPVIATNAEELREATKELVSVAIENKDDKFIRLAEQRTQKVIEYIRLIANLHNKSAYEYTPEQVEQIFQAIGSELSIMREILRGEFVEKKFSLRG